MKTEWEVTIPVTVHVLAGSREDAIRRAETALTFDDVILIPDIADDVRLDTPRVKHLWYKTAEQMLEDGASYNEVSESIGVGRKYIARAFPDMGMSQADGAKVRELKNSVGL